MKKTIIGALALVLVVFGACAEQKKGTKKAKANATTSGSNTTSIKSVSIHRTMCFGKCPDYFLTLSSDGKATYMGRKFAPYQGTYEKQFDAAKVQALFKEFERYKIDTCREEYEYMPDIAGLIYEINYTNGREQTIKNANTPFAPKYLIGLSEQMDALAPIDGTWKKTASWEEKK